MQRRKLLYLAGATLVTAAMGTFTGTALAAGSLTGDGSTLVAPIMAEWAQGFQGQTVNTVTYSPVGSGQGISDISHRLVDFAGSDAPLTPTQAAGCNGCYQIPWACRQSASGFT